MSAVRVVWVDDECKGKYYCLGDTRALVEYIKGFWWCLGGGRVRGNTRGVRGGVVGIQGVVVALKSWWVMWKGVKLWW